MSSLVGISLYSLLVSNPLLYDQITGDIGNGFWGVEKYISQTLVGYHSAKSSHHEIKYKNTLENARQYGLKYSPPV